MRPLILITNDDGIHSPGLLAVVEAVYKLGDVLVAAPHVQQTGMGRAFPKTSDLGIIEEVTLQVNGKNIIGYAVHGSPAYAVAHGVLELADRKPDLCISGINYGENMGMIPTCSGTVGATFEAATHQIPGIAVSIQMDIKYQRNNTFKEVHWDDAKRIVQYWARKTLEQGLPKDVDFLNINIPIKTDDVTQYRITRTSRQNYFELQKPEQREFKTPYVLKTKLVVHQESLEKDSDIYAVYNDKITSVTPMSCDMTAKIEEFM
ncbi:MAG: 5'/3'-nucleotidase SurE [Lachnospiraceae bacterium]